VVIEGLNEGIMAGQYIIDEIRSQLPECPIETVSIG
jgi:hypothetical protein